MNQSQDSNTYLNTVKRLCNFGRILHFEEAAQVPSSVKELYLKTFVSKSNLTAGKVLQLIIKTKISKQYGGFVRVQFGLNPHWVHTYKPQSAILS